MPLYRTILICTLSLFFLTACKQKKKVSLAGEEPVEINDFIEFFQPVSLSFTFTDSLLQKKDKDSLLVSYNIFTQFVPDTVLTGLFGKEKKLKIYALGKAAVPKGETYLFTKVVSGARKAGYIIVFDKSNQYITSMEALRAEPGRQLHRSTVIDRKYTITKTQLRRNDDGTTNEGKDIYVLNTEAKEFLLIMTDALEDKATELINPIDTLGRTHKWSTDYTSGKMNLVSIRDGRKNDRLTFFIHFEKNKGECTGELKGEAMIRSATIAEYREAGDPCVLQFKFGSNSVTLTELEGCGSRRGLRCSFDGVYPKKKTPKPKATKPRR